MPVRVKGKLAKQIKERMGIQAGKCQCPMRCKFCGRARSCDSVGHYCKTKNCQWSNGYEGCKLGLESPRKPRKPRGAKRVPKPVTEARSWKFVIPGWIPPSLNELLRVHWSKRSKMKEHATSLMCVYGRRKCDVACAFRKRTVLITLKRSGRRKELDADNAKKIILDALVKAGLLGDDSPAWVSCPDPVQIRWAECSTTIILQEIPE